MSDTTLDGFSREDLLRIMKRDRFVKEQQTQRMAGMVSENLELLAIIQELQEDLAEARGILSQLAEQQQEGATGNGDVHPVADSPVPSGGPPAQPGADVRPITQGA